MKEDKLGDLSMELSVEALKLTNIKITHVANMHGNFAYTNVFFAEGI